MEEEFFFFFFDEEHVEECIALLGNVADKWIKQCNSEDDYLVKGVYHLLF